jgi:hypothetical protein
VDAARKLEVVRLQPGLLDPLLDRVSGAGVIPNCTGRWVLCCITIARDATWSPWPGPSGRPGRSRATHYRIGSPLATHDLIGIYVGGIMWAGLMLRPPALQEAIVLGLKGRPLSG